MTEHAGHTPGMPMPGMPGMPAKPETPKAGTASKPDRDSGHGAGKSDKPAAPQKDNKAK